MCLLLVALFTYPGCLWSGSSGSPSGSDSPGYLSPDHPHPRSATYIYIYRRQDIYSDALRHHSFIFDLCKYSPTLFAIANFVLIWFICIACKSGCNLLSHRETSISTQTRVTDSWIKTKQLGTSVAKMQCIMRKAFEITHCVQLNYI